MKPRDLAIVVAVAIIGALAVLDALRSDASAPTADRQATDTLTRTETGPPAREVFPPVRARGSLVFATGDDCRLRDVSVSAGSEFPLPPIETACELWAAPVTNRLAYALRSTDGADVAPVRFLDVARSELDLGTFEAFGAVIWSHDGQLAAWCDSGSSGFEYEVGQFDLDTGGLAVRELDFCPRAYTPDGLLVHTADRQLVVAGGATFDVGGQIDQVAWGADGSVGLVVDSARFVRRVGSRVTHQSRIPGELQGMPPAFSPDNCAALFVGIGTVRIVDVGCFQGAADAYEGITATWSPDGQWVAIGRRDQIVFQRLVGGDDLVTWAASATSLAWRR